MTPPSLAFRLRAMAEEFAAMPERPSAEVSLAAANVLRGFAADVEAMAVGGWNVFGYRPGPPTKGAEALE